LIKDKVIFELLSEHFLRCCLHNFIFIHS